MQCYLTVPCMKDEFAKKEYENREYLGLQYLASALKKNGIKYKFVNAHAYRIDIKSLCEDILSTKVPFVGISCHSQKGFPEVRQLFQELRKCGYDGHICLGGFYASLNFEQIMMKHNEIDTILLGEGELTLPELIKQLENIQNIKQIPGLVYRENNKIISSCAKRIADLDQLNLPERDVNVIGNPQNGYSFSIVSGRGCYGRCNFCCKGIYFDNNYKIYRDPIKVIDEIEELKDKYNIGHFSFIDEIFYDNKGHKWVDLLVREIKKRNLDITFEITLRANDVKKELITKLAEVGLSRVSIGIESAVPRILKEMNKGITIEQSIKALQIIAECGVKPKFTFITFIPTMTFSELKTNYDFLFSVDNDILSEGNLYNRLNIFSGCEYEKILKKNRLLLGNINDFTERHNYNYIDKKVEIFVNNITKVRVYLSGVKTSVLEKKDETDDYRIKFEETKIQSKYICKEIIKDLLLLIEYADENQIDYMLEEFHDYTSIKVKLFELKIMELFN